MKNPCGKYSKIPYEIWTTGEWTWEVRKKYKNPEAEAKDPYARWFCFVTSPMCDGELGDVYVRDIMSVGARRIK